MGDAAVEHHMIACVNESLSLYLMSNARFMCERLVADFPSEVGLNHLIVPEHHETCTLQQAVLVSTFDTFAGQHLSAGDMLLQIRPGPSCIPLANG